MAESCGQSISANSIIYLHAKVFNYANTLTDPANNKSAISSYNSFGLQAYLHDGQLYSLMFA